MNLSQEDFMSEYKPIYISHRSKNIQDAVNTTLYTAPAPQKRPRKLARWVIVMTLMSLLGVGIQNAYSSLTDSDFFLMTHIRVLGNSLMSEAAIVTLSQLQVGTNLFACDITSATERVAQHPVVKKVLLHREPPATLVISIEERHPVGLLNTHNSLMGLDESGKIFPLPPAAQVDLPILTGVDLQRDKDSSWAIALAEFVTELQIRTPAFWREISEICTDTPHSATVYLVADDLALKMRFENPEKQIRNFRAYTQTSSGPGTDLAYIDLRYRDQVIVGRRQ